jgi:polar amino acid transport system substrate-binding protein
MRPRAGPRKPGPPGAPLAARPRGADALGMPTATRALLALVAVLPLAACGRGAGDPLARIQERGALIVALEAEFKPFEYVDPTGTIVGFDVDLARAIADDLGVKLELRNVKYETIVAELTSGKVDLIVSGMTITPERARSVRFTTPYFHTWTALLVSTSRASDVRQVEDLDREGRIVAVKEATTGEQVVRRLCPRAKVISHKTENAAALDVAEGRADAFLYDLSSLIEQQRQHPERTRVVSKPITVEPYGIATHPDDGTLLARVDALIAAMKEDGRLEALVARHKPVGGVEPR